jgi:hypothetical protein
MAVPPENIQNFTQCVQMLEKKYWHADYPFEHTEISFAVFCDFCFI